MVEYVATIEPTKLLEFHKTVKNPVPRAQGVLDELVKSTPWCAF
jgi:hypothetical protein